LNNPLKYVDPSGHDQIISSTGTTNADGQEGYFISDGEGNLLGVAYGLDDLAAKSSALESQSRGVDLPAAKTTVTTTTPAPSPAPVCTGVKTSPSPWNSFIAEEFPIRDLVTTPSPPCTPAQTTWSPWSSFPVVGAIDIIGGLGTMAVGGVVVVGGYEARCHPVIMYGGLKAIVLGYSMEVKGFSYSGVNLPWIPGLKMP